MSSSVAGGVVLVLLLGSAAACAAYRLHHLAVSASTIEGRYQLMCRSLIAATFGGLCLCALGVNVLPERFASIPASAALFGPLLGFTWLYLRYRAARRIEWAQCCAVLNELPAPPPKPRRALLAWLTLAVASVGAAWALYARVGQPQITADSDAMAIAQTFSSAHFLAFGIVACAITAGFCVFAGALHVWIRLSEQARWRHKVYGLAGFHAVSRSTTQPADY